MPRRVKHLQVAKWAKPWSASAPHAHAHAHGSCEGGGARRARWGRASGLAYLDPAARAERQAAPLLESAEVADGQAALLGDALALAAGRAAAAYAPMIVL